MRLINATTMQLERFDDDTKIPPYAILSHTWGSAEVSLQQFENTYMSDHIKKMLGYDKIVKACKQAFQDGHAYVWVDTCCIDKTSSAELGEAINSMFRWYKKAQICYAYLEDVFALSVPAGSTDIKELISEDELAEARWFTRGWTLQEVIAPREVHFYVHGWTFVGTKTSMCDKLARITGIHSTALRGWDVENFSVAKRMSWAAGRSTTRIEDISYSLMGLFDVNMPLLYGEGSKAFVRLQEEIMKDTEDQSLFSWSPTDRPALVDDRGHHRKEGTSIFASHPREFANVGDIYSLSPEGEPSTVTNKGVRIELPVLAMKGSVSSRFNLSASSGEPLFLVILYCGYEGNAYERPAIMVRRLEENTHTYVRHENAKIIRVHVDSIRATDTRQLYLRRKSHGGSAKRQTFHKLWGYPDGREKFAEARTYKRKKLEEDDESCSSSVFSSLSLTSTLSKRD